MKFKLSLLLLLFIYSCCGEDNLEEEVVVQSTYCWVFNVENKCSKENENITTTYDVQTECSLTESQAESLRQSLENVVNENCSVSVTKAKE